MSSTKKPTGASAGGKARARSLSPASRASIARKAAEARWGGPKATHIGDLEIGDLKIPCAVLENGVRVLSRKQAYWAFAKGNPGRKVADETNGFELPPILRAANLKPFISADLATALSRVIEYRNRTPHGGGGIAYGIEATLLPKICDVLLKAREAGALHHTQTSIAARAELLVRGLAHVGIIALVDEATGYQAERARDELNRILEAYIVEELRQWVALFPDEFFKQIFRLRGWTYREGSTKGPRYIGKLINRYVYDQLPPGVHQKLRELNPSVGGRRKHKHHQFLTEHTGEPHLDKQIAVVTTLMRVSSDNHNFEALFRKAFPRAGEQQLIPLEADET